METSDLGSSAADTSHRSSTSPNIVNNVQVNVTSCLSQARTTSIRSSRRLNTSLMSSKDKSSALTNSDKKESIELKQASFDQNESNHKRIKFSDTNDFATTIGNQDNEENRYFFIIFYVML